MVTYTKEDLKELWNPEDIKAYLMGGPEDLARCAEIDRTTSPSPELPNVKWPDKSKLTYMCPVCGKTCYEDGCSTTLVGYFSPPGHNHDDNCRHFFFQCEGHKFNVRVRNTCPATDCDWKGKWVCHTCGDNVKVYV